MEQEYVIYRTYNVTERDRGIRFVERVPLLDVIATPLIDVMARDWRTSSFEVSTSTTSSADVTYDTRPSVTPRTPNRRSVVGTPQLINETSVPLPVPVYEAPADYDELPLAV